LGMRYAHKSHCTLAPLCPPEKLLNICTSTEAPCIPHNAEQVRDGGRATTPRRLCTRAGMVWHGVLRAPDRCIYRGNYMFCTGTQGRDRSYCPAHVQEHAHLRAYKRLCGACVLLSMRYTHCADIPLHPRIQHVYIDIFSAWVGPLHYATCLTTTAKYSCTHKLSRRKSNEKFFIS
jgi:hypothetical protein